MLCLAGFATAQENLDSLQAVRKRLMETLKRYGDYDWELEHSSAVLDSLQSLPASMRPPAAPIYKLGKVYLQAGNHQVARRYFAAYKAHPKATETGHRLIERILESMRISDSVDATLERVKDPRDDHSYRVVKIGKVRWMAENLAYKSPGSICSSKEEKWCRVYGRLYDLASARDACMPQWHLPSQDDWKALLANEPDPLRLKGPELGGNNRSGFHALPGGMAFPKGEGAMSRSQDGKFWEEMDSDGSLNRWNFEEGAHEIERDPSSRSNMFSVRCVEGEGPKPQAKPVTTLGKEAFPAEPQKEFKDPRDGRVYPIVRVGGRDWMGGNLAWAGTDGKLGACSSDKPRECATDGRMYDWSMAMGLDPKFNGQNWGLAQVHVAGICPEGWLLPRQEDLKVLDSVAGMLSTDPGGVALKSRRNWVALSDGTSTNGTDRLRFNARPIGIRREYNGRLDEQGYRTMFWTSEDEESEKAFVLSLSNHTPTVDSTTWSKKDLLSVRCLR